MMGMVGRWIDGLTDEERDRIVEAVNWTWGGGPHEWPDATCLVLHSQADVWPETALVWQAFDKLCERFGLVRVVRVVKLRAGWVPELTPEPAPDQPAGAVG